MKILFSGVQPQAYLLATGQTTSYGSGDGVDDGALRRGIAKSYTILTAGQYAGVTNITINGKTDSHSNNCVVDNNTGLMWSRYASASVGPASDGKLPWTTNAGGEGIFPYAAAANAAAMAGYSDWRVPNVYEIMSLADYEAASSLPNSTAFPSFPAANIYHSTTRTTVTTDSYVIQFTAGTNVTVAKTTTQQTILVRG